MLRNNKMHWVAEPQLLFSIFLFPLSLCCTLSLLDLSTQQSLWLRWIKLCTNYLIYILCLITTKDSPHSCKCFCIHVWVCQIQRDEFSRSRTFPSRWPFSSLYIVTVKVSRIEIRKLPTLLRKYHWQRAIAQMRIAWKKGMAFTLCRRPVKKRLQNWFALEFFLISSTCSIPEAF